MYTNVYQTRLNLETQQAMNNISISTRTNFLKPSQNPAKSKTTCIDKEREERWPSEIFGARCCWNLTAVDVVTQDVTAPGAQQSIG